MKIKLGELRRLIREASTFPGKPTGRNVLSPDVAHREQIGSLASTPMDTVTDDEGLPDHLFEPTITPEECYGPVPPEAEEPYVIQDPFVSDAAPKPFSGGGSIKRG